MSKTGILSLLLFLITPNLFGQSFELNVYGNRNFFYNFNSDDDHEIYNYKSASGYSAGLSYENSFGDTLPFKITVGYENYSASVKSIHFALGGGSNTSYDARKNCLKLDLYPLCFMIENLHLNFGIGFNFLLNESISGYASWSRINTSSQTVYYDNECSADLSKKIGAGFVANFTLDVHLKDDLFLVPQYLFRLGLTNEFNSISTLSHRHSFGIGIKRNLLAK